MFRIKKIDIYVFKRFLTLFFMTFMICLLILLMQFLWRHVNELVGKGIEWSVLGEFFVYASFSMVPMALPLAILLASLMTFGNLGENFELTAMKAAGISLFRIIRPLIFFISLVCIGAFFFSNYVLPIAQAKLYSLIISLKQKSPEIDIPEGEFYSNIPNINIYVRKKDQKIMKDMMIYDFTSGFDNANVMVADSGKIQFSEDKKYLLLTLYDGESFSNLQRQSLGSAPNSIPYRREIFKLKEILLDFDSDLNRLNESALKDQQISKNVSQLSQSIDSVSKITNATSSVQAKQMVSQNYLGREELRKDIVNNRTKINAIKYNSDSIFLKLDQSTMERASFTALERAKMKQSQIEMNLSTLSSSIKYVSRHEIAWHRIFTLSFACLIFFFIGAPLGAIIRKGGLGTPIVISVIMFIFYYIIDNTGYKMAREGLWTSFEGIWLSSAVLLPIGIYLTYNAAIDSTLFSPQKYKNQWEVLKRFFNHFKKTPKLDIK